MTRPKKNWKVSKNETSFQCWYNDQYLGSIGSKKLCLMVAEINGTQIRFTKSTVTAKVKGEIKPQKQDFNVKDTPTT